MTTKLEEIEDTMEILCILDRSGSMLAIRDDCIGGFNAFIEEQKKAPGKTLLTLVQFDHEYEVIHRGVDIKDVPPLTGNTYIPRGSTALHDAVGKAIGDLDARRNSNGAAGGTEKVMIAILTDGHENSSREFKLDQIKKIVEDKKKSGWEFVFIGAGLDSFDAQFAGNGLGINNVASVGHSARGMHAAYSTISCCMADYRETGRIKNPENPFLTKNQNYFPKKREKKQGIKFF